MKFKLDKDILKIIVLLFVVIFAFYFISDRSEQYPSFSVLNKSREGLSVFYEALQELDIPVSRTERAVSEHSHDSVQITAYEHNYNFDVNDEQVKEWVKKGGILVCLTPDKEHQELEGFTRSEVNGMEVYRLSGGEIIFADLNNLVNKNIGENTEEAYKILPVLSREDSREIFFNEDHFFSESGQSSLWTVFPVWIKIIIYQMLLAVSAFIYLKGKRFGKPLPLYEETERIENEYIYSAAALYKRTKSWDLMLENYYHDFLRTVELDHDKWLKYWQNEEIPAFNKAQKVYLFMDNYKKEAGKELGEKESIKIINSINELKKVLKEKREGYWK